MVEEEKPLSWWALLEALEHEAQQHSRAAARVRRLIEQVRQVANIQRKEKPRGKKGR